MQSNEPLKQKIYQVVFMAIATLALACSHCVPYLPLIARVVVVPVVLISSYLLANVVYKKSRRE